MSSVFRLPIDGGGFSLAASVRFVEGFAPAAADPAPAGSLRLAFPVEGDWTTAGVELHQEGDGDVVGEVVGEAPPDRVAVQVAHILSLDVDGSGFGDVGRRDPVVGRLQERYSGLRPVCFWSPYEAAAWAVISHRIRIVQAAAIKRRISEEAGVRVSFADGSVAAFPSPRRLLEMELVPGLDGRKVARLNAVAEAALAGDLDSTALRELPPADALARLQCLPGIGPFFAELILVRGAGAPDVWPSGERRLHDAMIELYELGRPGPGDLATIAEAWRPYRSWASVLIRHWREDETGEITGRQT